MTEHDYTNRCWGHDFCINEVIEHGAILEMCGWGRGIQNGDYLLLPNEGKTTRYQVGRVSYEMDPPDMWSVTARFAPRPQRTQQCETQKV